MSARDSGGSQSRSVSSHAVLRDKLALKSGFDLYMKEDLDRDADIDGYVEKLEGEYCCR